MPEVTKVCKFELNLSDEDRQFLLDTFKGNEQLARIVYNVIRSYGYRFIAVEGNTGRVPAKLRRVIKECIEGYGVFEDWRKSFIYPQVDKVWEAFVGTYKSYRKMPSEDIVKSLGRVIRVRVSKRVSSGRFYKRMLMLSEECGYIFADIRIRGRVVKALLAPSDGFRMVIDAMYGVNSLSLGDPAELIRYGEDRIFLHLPVKKRVELPRSADRVVGVSLGVSEYFLTAVAYDLKEDSILGVLKVPSKRLRDLWRFYEELQKRRAKAFRPKRGSIGREYYRYFHRMKNRLMQMAKEGRVEYDRLLELILKPEAWLIPYQHNPRRARKVWKGRSGVELVPRDELGRSMWWLSTRYFICECVNRLVSFDKQYGCRIIVHGRLTGLRGRVRELKLESRRLGILYQRERDYMLLRRKRAIDRAVKILSRFPYATFLSDLKVEANWNGISVRAVSPVRVSVTCPKCGYQDRVNRASRSLFLCRKCGYTDHPDFVSAVNVIKRWKAS